MSIESKKIDMAGKMYKQNGVGGKGGNPKFKMGGKGEGSSPVFKMKGSGKGSASPTPLSFNGSFKAKYSQSGKSNKQPMIVGKSESKQKGRKSLESAGKNEGERMMLAGNEHNRA